MLLCFEHTWMSQHVFEHFLKHEKSEVYYHGTLQYFHIRNRIFELFHFNVKICTYCLKISRGQTK